MRFVAIDVETANPNLSSICQVGLAVFDGGALVDTWDTLIDPQDFFDDMNIFIHGIDESVVEGAPTWSEVYPKLSQMMSGAIVVSHTSFDKTAINLACECNNTAKIECRWLDSAKVVRRAWPELFGFKGYGLRNVADHFGINFEHHDAVEDARAAGEILCKACDHTGLSLDDWFFRILSPIDPSISNKKSNSPITREGSAEGSLFGNVIVFTGALSIPRNEAADLAAIAGCDVGANVTKKTTLLVVGDQDIKKLAGRDKSNKHLKAEELIKQGHGIRILGESDFRKLVEA